MYILPQSVALLYVLAPAVPSREQELFPGNVVHSVDFLSSIIGLQKLKTKLDQRREDRNRSQGRYKSKERVRGTPSSLDPPPNPVKWAVKGTSPHLSQPSSVVNTSSSSAPNTPSLSALNTLPLSVLNTPRSHHSHDRSITEPSYSSASDEEWSPYED